MPSAIGPLDDRIQQHLDDYSQHIQQLVENGELGREDSQELLDKYQKIARQKHDDIVALISEMGIDDAMFEAGQRYDADNLQDPHLKTLLVQFPDMRDLILSGKDDIVRHTDRGLSAQDAFYETEIVRIGRGRDLSFRRDVETVFSAGLYETRIDAVVALDQARDRAWKRSLANQSTVASHTAGPAGSGPTGSNAHGQQAELPDYFSDRGRTTSHRGKLPSHRPHTPRRPAHHPHIPRRNIPQRRRLSPQSLTEPTMPALGRISPGNGPRNEQGFAGQHGFSPAMMLRRRPPAKEARKAAAPPDHTEGIGAEDPDDFSLGSMGCRSWFRSWSGWCRTSCGTVPTGGPEKRVAPRYAFCPRRRRGRRFRPFTCARRGDGKAGHRRHHGQANSPTAPHG
ncbi:hypothetical protein ACQEU8_03925 [Streptomyces sp. CA-250714]|uniref:hypothetical protein n=1 Tax=Streptomyces sp. CA-250714 TaxID=3240060 RepID=UPI003D8FA186